jgi:hypothetical protein
MSAGTPGIAATQKGKIQWWGAAYENIKVVRRNTEEDRLPRMFPVANYRDWPETGHSIEPLEGNDYHYGKSSR